MIFVNQDKMVHMKKSNSLTTSKTDIEKITKTEAKLKRENENKNEKILNK